MVKMIFSNANFPCVRVYKHVSMRDLKIKKINNLLLFAIFIIFHSVRFRRSILNRIFFFSFFLFCHDWSPVWLPAVRYSRKIKIMKDTWDAYLPPFVSIRCQRNDCSVKRDKVTLSEEINKKFRWKKCQAFKKSMFDGKSVFTFLRAASLSLLQTKLFNEIINKFQCAKPRYNHYIYLKNHCDMNVINRISNLYKDKKILVTFFRSRRWKMDVWL